MAEWRLLAAITLWVRPSVYLNKAVGTIDSEVIAALQRTSSDSTAEFVGTRGIVVARHDL